MVGGAAAVLLGAPIHTLDLDLVHDRSPANLDRLHAALVDLDACYREHLPATVVRPRMQDLALVGHHLLMTTYGPLDLLGSVGKGRTHDLLIAHVESIELSGIGRVLVLDLPTMIEIKEELGRDKDRIVLPVLRRTLEERRRRECS